MIEMWRLDDKGPGSSTAFSTSKLVRFGSSIGCVGSWHEVPPGAVVSGFRFGQEIAIANSGGTCLRQVCREEQPERHLKAIRDFDEVG